MWWVWATASAAIPPEAWQWSRDSSWPTLDPSGARIAWIDGVAPAADADLCVSSVATPFDCVAIARVSPTSEFGWLDEHTLGVRTDDAWTTCGESGCEPWQPIAEGERVFVWGDHVLHERPEDRPKGLEGRLLYEAGQDSPVGSWDERRAGAGTVYGVDGAGKGQAVLRPSTPRWVVDQTWQRWQPATSQSWDRHLLAFDGDRDRTALVSIDLATGRKEILFDPEQGPITDVWQDTTDGRPLAVAERWSRSTWHPLDPAIADDIAWLEEHVDGDFHPIDADVDQPVWLLLVWNGRMASHALLYDRAHHTLTRAPPTFGASEDLVWRPMETPEVVAPDGLEIPTYLTRPDPDRFGPGPYPTVVWVHGGPWGDGSHYGFDEMAQAFADLGLAYVAVDFRGSAGYGRTFADAPSRDVGRAIQSDIYAAIDTLVAQGTVAPDRVGWLGGSHGGYAVLIAATTQPDHLTCGVSYAGPPRWEWLWGHPVADPERVSRPLLLVQGDEDKNVRPGAVRKFADRAVAAGAPVTLIELPGDGHALDHQGPMVFPLVTTFLADCLGVPSDEPSVPAELDLVVRHDAAHVRGLPGPKAL